MTTAEPMSKKRKNQQRQQTGAKPIAPIVPAKATPVPPPASGSTSTPKPVPISKMWPLALVPVIAVIGVIVWFLGRNAAPASNATASSTSSTFQPFVGKIGGVTGCRKQSAFSQRLGFGRSTVLSTAERTIKGLVIVEPQANNAPPRTYQHPSWAMGGYLGPNAIDKDGNIYVAPAPRVNLIDNPPERANVIYKVDATTGVMTAFVDLPYSHVPSLTNPYGILGLTYDCDTHSLYASSVAGSSRQAEVGRLFRVDLATGEVSSQFDNIDALGMGVFNGAKGKRLYFGSARAQDVRSIELDASGDFHGEPRNEFSLQDLGPDGNDKARKISFDTVNDMIVNGTKFTYNLAPPEAQRLPASYRYRYDADADQWSYVDTSAGPGSAGQ